MPTTTCSSPRRTRRLRLALAGVATLLLALPGGLAAAQDADDEPADEAAAPAEAGFAVQPSGPDGPGGRDWFTYTLDPGDTFGDTVAISNLSNSPIRFAMYPTDAQSVEGVGGFAAPKDTEEPVGVGTWITLAADEYVVEPGKRIDVPFSITVPDDAEPGDHAGAILAVDADAAIEADGDDAVNLDVLQRVGARVYVRVNGATSPALKIDSLEVERDGSSATVLWEVTNTGNLRLTPAAEVRITGFLGRTVRTLPVQDLPELLPGANYVGGSQVTGLPGNERLTAHLVLTADGVEVERSVSFGTYPWLLLGIAALVLLGLVWLLRRRRRARRQRAGDRPPPRAEEKIGVPA